MKLMGGGICGQKRGKNDEIDRWGNFRTEKRQKLTKLWVGKFLVRKEAKIMKLMGGGIFGQKRGKNYEIGGWMNLWMEKR